MVNKLREATRCRSLSLHTTLPPSSRRVLSYPEFVDMLGRLMRTGHFDSDSLVVRSDELYPTHQVCVRCVFVCVFVCVCVCARGICRRCTMVRRRRRWRRRKKRVVVW